MDQAIVLDIGREGGGITIYGRQVDGVWSFWAEGASIDVDENEDMVWRTWSREPVASIDILLPKGWPVFSPISVHPEFVDWFRAIYEKARAGLPENERSYQEKYIHVRWLEMLGLPWGSNDATPKLGGKRRS
jgi:hypothetical protein